MTVRRHRPPLPAIVPARPGPRLARLARLIPAALLAAALLLSAACSPAPDAFQGWVEGEYVLVAPPLAGRLLERPVRRGDRVAAGAPLFRLEDDFQAAAVREAEDGLAQAQRQLDDQSKGKRPTELASIEAQLREARAALDYSRTDYERKKALYAERTISAEELDRARTTYDADNQAVRRLQADLATARLGGRSDALAAAQAAVGAAQARLDQARWNLDQKRQAAPADALVFDTFYEPGEWVAAGSPVVSLLPPGNVKVIFFVPETMAAAVHPGDRVRVSFDGAAAPAPAVVDYVSPEAEFTPPVIYSSQNRAKLVYRVEARPDTVSEAAGALRVGQPVDVTLAGSRAPAASGPAASGPAASAPVPEQAP
ncbi:MAG: HlyD family secretion protein [Desulfovibrionaceae bacterium]